MTEIVLGKLQEAFAYDCSVEEACFYADINPDTYYSYVKKHPDFSERVKALKQRPILAARQKVIKDIEDNVDTAKWYLERKRKSEFSNKTEVSNTHRIISPIMSLEESNAISGNDGDTES
jgi:hypothetical protein